MAGSITFRFLGGDRFMVDLRAWQGKLQAQVRAKAKDTAELAVSIIANEMPHGEMRARLRAYLERETELTFAYRVHSPSPISNMWEFGNNGKIRRDVMRNIFIPGVGWRRTTSRGAMPKAKVFVNEVVAARVRFHVNCREILGRPVPEIGSGAPDVIGSL